MYSSRRKAILIYRSEAACSRKDIPSSVSKSETSYSREIRKGANFSSIEPEMNSWKLFDIIGVRDYAQNFGSRRPFRVFDTYSLFSLSLIYVCCTVFEETFIVKPHRSRTVNSER